MTNINHTFPDKLVFAKAATKSAVKVANVNHTLPDKQASVKSVRELDMKMDGLNNTLPDLRLWFRYFEIVKAHIQHSQSTAAGPAIPVSLLSSFATTQALWRFLANDRVTMEALVAPVRQLAHQQIGSEDEYVLSVIDWSKIDYQSHGAKKDVTQLSHDLDIGYELTTQLLVSAKTGLPIAPIQMHIKTAAGYLTTASTPVSTEPRLEQITPIMNAAKEMKFSARLVYIIDREADSVRHLREWNRLGQIYIVRADDRWVTWRGTSLQYEAIAAQLDLEGGFVKTREVQIKGKQGIQYVAETKIILDRPARRKVNGKKIDVPGEPLELRLVITRVFDATSGALLSTWYLLSNLPMSISAATIALWYYWRWSIESYFKLMKSGGHELEHWGQQSGAAILKRLLIASMASALVWQLQSVDSDEAKEFKKVLVGLSGKSVKRGQPPTAGTLLSGLFVFLRIFDFLDTLDFDLAKLGQLRLLLKKFFPHLTE